MYILVFMSCTYSEQRRTWMNGISRRIKKRTCVKASSLVIQHQTMHYSFFSSRGFLYSYIVAAAQVPLAESLELGDVDGRGYGAAHELGLEDGGVDGRLGDEVVAVLGEDADHVGGSLRRQDICCCSCY